MASICIGCGVGVGVVVTVEVGSGVGEVVGEGVLDGCSFVAGIVFWREPCVVAAGADRADKLLCPHPLAMDTSIRYVINLKDFILIAIMILMLIWLSPTS